MSFPFFKQLDSADCGPACLKMISEYYGKKYSLEFLRKKCYATREGVSLLSISDAAENIGFNTLKLELSLDKLFDHSPLPCILFWKQDHFIVLYNIKRNKNNEVVKIYLSDPAIGLVSVDLETFSTFWLMPENRRGIALLLEPSEEFLQKNTQTSSEVSNSVGLKFLFSYFFKYKKYYAQLIIGILSTSALSLMFPFLTQNIVDIGIKNGDINFIFLILIFQLFLFLCGTMIDLIQNQLLLHISTGINISIISDFLGKLMRLPIKFFDSKNVGDIINRINDQKRVETFITNSIVKTFFSTINFFIFTIVLAIYNATILLIFLAGSILTFAWVLLFMKKRRQLDYKTFNILSQTNENVYELVNGMQEIKLNHFEDYKKSQWQDHQAKLFSLNLSTLKLEQYQTIGSFFFSQLKNIFITVIAAQAVINGEITLGMMLSVSFIIGQLNSPFEQFISFVKSFQNAKISITRMKEVYNEPDEDLADERTANVKVISNSIPSPNSESIELRNVSFSYDGPRSIFALKNISMEIPIGKVTAIVGASGSGKTTLLKLLLKFYTPVSGAIFVNGLNLENIPAKQWRQDCGTVMQEAYIFSDTIKRNIIPGDQVNLERLNQACQIACISDYIETLALGVNTKIGASGIGLSTGQKQRILIARAVYRDPNILFFDEATSALDANTEKAITQNLSSFYKGKTVVIVAHRLSTVKNADQIIVLDQGEIVERGIHSELIKDRKLYFDLIKNQLELGN